MRFTIASIIMIVALAAPGPADSSLYTGSVRNPVPLPVDCSNGGIEIIPEIEAALASRATSELDEEIVGDQAPFRQLIKWQAMNWRVRKALVDESTVSQEEIAEFYGKTIERFQHGEARHGQYIFAEAREESVRDEIRNVLSELRKRILSGDSWGEIKKEAQRRGYHVSSTPFIAVRGQFSPVLEEAIFSTPAGQVSDITEGEPGMHLFYVSRVVEAASVSLEEATPRLVEELKNRKALERREEITEHLRQQFPVKAEGKTVSIGDEVIKPEVLQLEGHTYDGSDETVLEAIDQAASGVRIYLYGLNKVGQDDPDFRTVESYLMNNYLAQVWLEEAGRNVTVSSAEIAKQYNENLEQYRLPKEKHVFEISIPITFDSENPESYRAGEKEVRETLTTLRTTILEGESIEKATETSKEVKVADLGMAPPGPRGFLADLGVENLEAGECSQVIFEKQRGYLFYVSDVKPSRLQTLEEASERIESNLRSVKIQKRITEEICAQVAILENETDSGASNAPLTIP